MADYSTHKPELESNFNRFEYLKNQKNEQFMFENSIRVADIIYNRLYPNGDGEPMVLDLLIAHMQAGKTAAMCALIKNVIFRKSKMNKIIVIGCMSENSWVYETSKRLPSMVKVFHRGQIRTPAFTNEFAELEHSLIIFDETHIACGERHGIAKILKDRGLTRDYMIDNDIRILEVSATPDGVMEEARKHGLIDKPVVMEPGEGYRGLKELKMADQLREYNDLECLNNGDVDLNTFFTNVAELEVAILSYSAPRYHVLRARGGGQMINSMKIYFSDRFDYINYDSENKETVKNLKNSLPGKHTIIFIKEFWRQAHTLKDIFGHDDNGYISNIGVLYDRWSKDKKDSVLCQSLAGRACGYFKNNCIIFTHLESVDRYISGWENGWEQIENWNSQTLKVNGTSRKTKNTKIRNVHTNDDVDDGSDCPSDFELCMFEVGCDLLESKDCRKYIKNILHLNPLNFVVKLGVDNNGFYICGPNAAATKWSYDDMKSLNVSWNWKMNAGQIQKLHDGEIGDCIFSRWISYDSNDIPIYFLKIVKKI